MSQSHSHTLHIIHSWLTVYKELYSAEKSVHLLYICKVTLLTLNGNVNNQNNLYWYPLHEIALYNLKVRDQCATNVCKTMWSRLLEETINSYPYYIHLNLATSFKELTKQRQWSFFMHHNAIVHRTNFSVVALEEIVGKWLISHVMWPSRSQNLNTCNYYLWGALKDRVYMNVFLRCRACLEAGGKWFQTHLWNKVAVKCRRKMGS
jgi:hypothetical protein